MPLGGEVDLGPGDIVLDGDPAPAKGHSFRPMPVVANRTPPSGIKYAYCTYLIKKIMYAYGTFT